jgi:uncharacterized cupin superfamily protein
MLPGRRVARVPPGWVILDNRPVAVVNISSAESPAGRIDVAALLGSSELAMFVYDLAPGQASCPYHYEFTEEWLLVVAGSIAVRVPDGVLELSAGDLVRFEPGPAGAHKIMNRSADPARTLLFSSAKAPAVSVYPDSGKVGVWPDGDTEYIFVRDTAVAWSHGEDGWDKAD